VPYRKDGAVQGTPNIGSGTAKDAYRPRVHIFCPGMCLTWSSRRV
jgi:hypothetical protein